MDEQRHRRIIVWPDADALARAAAEHIARIARDSIAARGRFTLALAGGSTPEKTYHLLAGPEYRRRIDWAETFLFFGDERFVPPDDDRSNYRMARRALLQHVPVSPDRVFPVDTSLPTAEDAARAYAGTLFEVTGGEPPVLDLILLGLGDDGHTASLFPHAAALTRTDVSVTASPPGTLPPPVERVTLTFPTLNAARNVVFLVAGEGKADAVRDVLEGNGRMEDRPAAGVRPAGAPPVWLLDRAAARLLSAATGG